MQEEASEVGNRWEMAVCCDARSDFDKWFQRPIFKRANFEMWNFWTSKKRNDLTHSHITCNNMKEDIVRGPFYCTAHKGKCVQIRPPIHSNYHINERMDLSSIPNEKRETQNTQRERERQWQQRFHSTDVWRWGWIDVESVKMIEWNVWMIEYSIKHKEGGVGEMGAKKNSGEGDWMGRERGRRKKR